MSEHTPGPWRVIDETDVLALDGTPDSIVVASTKFFEGPSTDRERADARLIAAAPDLLEALKEMASLGPHALVRRHGKAQAKAIAALEKAEGRQP